MFSGFKSLLIFNFFISDQLKFKLMFTDRLCFFYEDIPEPELILLHRVWLFSLRISLIFSNGKTSPLSMFFIYNQ